MYRMKISKVLSVSLGLLTAITCSVGQVFAATISIPGYSGTGATGLPAECGSGQAQFLPAPFIPLSTKLGVFTDASLNFAGLIVLAPNASADPTNVSTLLPIPFQGNFTQKVQGFNNGNQGSFVVQTYVAYSFVDGNGVTNYGVSVVPTQIAQIITNQGLKGKSASAYAIGDTNLAGLRNSGLLLNYIGNAPDNNSSNFVLLGVGQGVFGSSGSIADLQFNAPTLNQSTLPGSTSTLLYPPVSGGSNSPVGKDTASGANLNCSTFITIPLK
jgi:hypothetical protein